MNEIASQAAGYRPLPPKSAHVSFAHRGRRLIVEEIQASEAKKADLNSRLVEIKMKGGPD